MPFLLLCNFMFLSSPVLPALDLEKQRLDAIQQIYEQIVKARSWASSMSTNLANSSSERGKGDLAWVECLKLYDDSEQRVRLLIEKNYDLSDAATWLSGAMTAHSTCMEGLGRSNESRGPGFWEIISKALELHTVSVHQLVGEFVAYVRINRQQKGMHLVFPMDYFKLGIHQSKRQIWWSHKTDQAATKPSMRH
ncbi:pectinesterase [Carex littledalei]|uniref:Pectinesterase n=1 Tax=Carex littledalei TaxID=544730 RepID=A0A833QT27_9POAL|nr:pectinesterase [Carex littledalei]